MFPDSKIGSSFQMGPDKLQCYVTFLVSSLLESVNNWHS